MNFEGYLEKPNEKNFITVRTRKAGDNEAKILNGYSRIIEHFSNYVEKTEANYDAEDVVLSGVVYDQTHEKNFEKVIRNKFGKRKNHKFNTREAVDENCFIPTDADCLLKCVKFLVR